MQNSEKVRAPSLSTSLSSLKQTRRGGGVKISASAERGTTVIPDFMSCGTLIGKIGIFLREMVKEY